MSARSNIGPYPTVSRDPNPQRSGGPRADHPQASPIALVCEASGGGGGQLALDLARLGWGVRVVDRDLRPFVTLPADLWVVDLGALACGNGPSLGGLLQVPAAAPLLLVADGGHLGAHRAEMISLIEGHGYGLHLMVRPYAQAELATRVFWAMWMWGHATARGEVYEVGGLRVDVGKHKAWLQGRLVYATPSEFRALAALAQAGGEVVSSDGLLEALHGAQNGYDPATLKPHICRLRHRLEEAGAQPGCIVAVRGVGYYLNAASLGPPQPK